MEIREGVPLAPLCTLALGGAARFLAEPADEGDLREAAAWAVSRAVGLVFLGGGSNLVVADLGVDALVLRLAIKGVRVERSGAEVLVTAGAGEPWDAFVARCVVEGWQGIECLSGIPGTVGGTPIQNVGAYGQEVSETIRSVRVLDLASGSVRELPPPECGFSYRTSVFRGSPGRLAVLAATFALRPGAPPDLRYAELARAVAARHAAPSLGVVRAAVLELRRGKSMVVDPDDASSRSVGSFFVNPVLGAAEAERLAQGAVAAGLVREASLVPIHPVPGGRVKVSAAWLIEKAGFPRGTRRGAVGVSPSHALALVHHGGGTAAELVALARDIRAAVRARFDVDLRPEPVFWGFPTADPTA